MKKMLLILGCFHLLSTHAQELNKGDKLFGGSFSFSVFNANSDGVGYYNTGNAGVLPSFSWLVQNNLAMGIRGSLGYNKNEIKYDNGEKRIIQSFNSGVGVFLKKYKLLKEKFGVFFDNELSGNYIVNKERSVLLPDGKNEAWGVSYRFSPGVFYKFSKHFLGEATIGGAYASYYGGEGIRNIGAGLSFLQYFNLGINYQIEKRKKS